MIIRILMVVGALWVLGCGNAASTGEKTGNATDVADNTGGADPAASDVCVTDDDCVKASCCHATACVAKSAAPDCKEMMCTADCKPGTMDCGGGCKCVEGKCSAQLGEPTAAANPPM